MKALLLCICMIAMSHAAVGKPSIYRMMIGGRILELAGTRQLTSLADGEVASASISPDGKYVVYLRKHLDDYQACLTKLTGGRTTIVMSPPPNHDEEGFTGEAWTPYGAWTWSPDSTRFTLFASHSEHTAAQKKWGYAIAVFNLAGARQACFGIEDKAEPDWPALRWSPDGRRFAGAFRPSGAQEGSSLRVFDILSGLADKLLSQETFGIGLVSWSPDSRSLQYTAPADKGKTQLREFSLDTREDKVIQAEYNVPRVPSPDGLLDLDWGTGISIRNRLTGEVTQLIKAKPDGVLGWSANNKMLAYQKTVVLEDDSGKRKQVFNSLWLVAAEANPFNHMCVAFDSKNQLPTWSSDCLKMAYISDGKLYVAEFAWKPMTPYDKLDAGLPLTEKDEQTVLMDKAREVGSAMEMYVSDWDGKYPSAEKFVQMLDSYTRDRTLFFRPGTETIAFQYFPLGNIADVKYPATTVVGFFDVGYGWKVILYADGHVQIVPK